jgi:hypothetical protein
VSLKVENFPKVKMALASVFRYGKFGLFSFAKVGLQICFTGYAVVHGLFCIPTPTNLLDVTLNVA